MIITRTWLQEFINISRIHTNDICKTLNSIGLEVDSAKKIVIPTGVVVGKVIQKDKHPDADKLSICQVDIGSEILQIVCGAKNVDIKQYVPIATIGTTLENGLKIKASELRGVASNGMICSSSELGLPKLDDGILVLDNSIGKLVLGKELNLYSIFSDDIIEIELTANRGDCLSINGIARELATAYNLHFLEEEKPVKYNDFGIGQVLEIDSSSDIDSSLAFKVANFSKFKLPIIYKLRVALIDKYSGNCIEDTLSYVTHSLGIILNAYTKKDSATKNGELSLLTIKKDQNGFDCVYGEKLLNTIGVDIAKISKDNDVFIIQASYTNPEILSKKVFETKIKTGDAYYLSSRGSEPDIIKGIDYLSSFISKYGATLYAGSEQFIEDRQMITLDICIDKINSIIGQNIQRVQIEAILNSLGFEIKDANNEVLSIKVPLFRHDIKNIADIAEEVVRIIGIDNIKSKPLAVCEANRVNKVSNSLIKKNQIRAKAITNGFFETITYIFSSKELLKKYGFQTVEEKKDILNPITNELNTYRTTQLLNLVEAASKNVKQGFKRVAFFEIGTVFNSTRNEFRKVSFIYSGQKENESFLNSGKPSNITFFEFAQKVLNCTNEFELIPMNDLPNSFIHPFQNATILLEGKDVGYISKLHPSVANDFDLDDTFIAQIDFDSVKLNKIKANPYSKFQSSKRDLSILAPKSLAYLEIKKIIKSIKNKNIKQFNLVDVYNDANLKDNQSITIRFVLQNDEKTLEEEEITQTMNQILEELKNALSIGLR